MKAPRIHAFGGPEVILIEDVPRPIAAAGEILVRVVAAGVGPWDAIIRKGNSKVGPQPPLTLGSDLSGVVEEVGPGVKGFQKGDELYGVTNPQFRGANAEYAIASSGTIAAKPKQLSHVEAASAPVVAVTAWQMLFDYGKAKQNQAVLILGAAGNVGAYAVQLVLDLVGGDTRERAARVVRPGGPWFQLCRLVLCPQDPTCIPCFFTWKSQQCALNKISALFNRGVLAPKVGPFAVERDSHSTRDARRGTS